MAALKPALNTAEKSWAELILDFSGAILHSQYIQKFRENLWNPRLNLGRLLTWTYLRFLVAKNVENLTRSEQVFKKTKFRGRQSRFYLEHDTSESTGPLLRFGR